MQVALLIYVAGVVLGAWRTDASPAGRVVIALLWPLGPLAFAATITGLLAASLVAFPLVGAAVTIAGALLWWWVA